MSAESAGIPLLLPKLGHSMESATIVTWHVAEGEAVREGQLLVSIETDKATYDLESPGTGTVHIVVPQGEEVGVESLIASVGAVVPSPAVRELVHAAPPPTPTGLGRPRPEERIRSLASPRAKHLAAELGVDLATVSASGSDGIISAEDVSAAAARGPESAMLAADPGTSRREVGRERLAGIRRTAARRLQEAWQTIPHIVQVVDADATGLVAERERLKQRGLNVSVNDLFLYATARALASIPELNVALVREELVRYEGVDLGFAVETPRGLLVPVVRRADSLAIGDFAAEVQRLAAAARDGKLGPDDMGGASLTVSNLGMHGIRMGTPVINLGEPALVFVGTIENRPVAIDSTVVVRPQVTVSIAYDHRVADGVLAASLTRGIKAAIESYPPGAEEQTLVGRRKLRSTSTGAGFRVEVEGRNRRRWLLDEPVEDGGHDEGPTPVDAFLGALLGCMTMAFKAAATRQSVPIDGIDGSIAANPRRQISHIAIRLEVTSPASEADLHSLLPLARRICFVSGVLREEIEYRVELVVVRPGLAG